MLIGDPKSNKVIVHDILRELKNSGYDNFTGRPWNFNKADTSLWWLVPSTEWPSYKYGKIAFYKEKGKYRIGLNVEKGISKIVAQTFNISAKASEKIVLEENWPWYELLRDIESGRLQEVLDAITEKMQKPLKIIIQVTEFKGNDSRPVEFEGLDLVNSISFDYANNELNSIKAQGKMRKHAKIKSLENLIEIIKFEGDEWFWIDLYFLFELEESELPRISEYASCFIENYNQMFI